MSKAFTKKNIDLMMEFDRYMMKRLHLFNKIPNKSTIMFTIKGDQNFNRQSASLMQKARIRPSKIVEARKEGRGWKFFSPPSVFA